MPSDPYEDSSLETLHRSQLIQRARQPLTFQPFHHKSQLSKLCIYTLVALKEENAALLTNEKIASSLRVNREYSFNGTFFLPPLPESYIHPLHLEAKLLSVREHVKVTDR